MAKPNASSAPLPAERIQAGRFGKARLARANALREDYVELIADLLETEGEARPTDIARRLGVSHVSVVKAIARLKRDGVGHGALTSSFQIGADDLDQIVGTRGPLLRPERGRAHIAADMILDDLRHEPVNRAAHRGDDLQHIGAGNLGLKRALDGVDLPKNPPDASQELRFFPDRMRHDCFFCSWIA
jgi:hypothetical protein